MYQAQDLAPLGVLWGGPHGLRPGVPLPLSHYTPIKLRLRGPWASCRPCCGSSTPIHITRSASRGPSPPQVLHSHQTTSQRALGTVAPILWYLLLSAHPHSPYPSFSPSHSHSHSTVLILHLHHTLIHTYKYTLPSPLPILPSLIHSPSTLLSLSILHTHIHPTISSPYPSITPYHLLALSILLTQILPCTPLSPLILHKYTHPPLCCPYPSFTHTYTLPSTHLPIDHIHPPLCCPYPSFSLSCLHPTIYSPYPWNTHTHTHTVVC